MARNIAARKNEELYRKRQFPDEHKRTQRQHNAMREVVADFVSYLRDLGRSYSHVNDTKSRLDCLCDWMERNRMQFVQDVTPKMLRGFLDHVVKDRRVYPFTANAYLDAVHNFFGYVIYKRRLMKGSNPAATGRQA